MQAHARAYAFDRGEDADAVRTKLLSTNPGSLVQIVRGGSVKNEMLVEMLAAQTIRAESSGSLLARKAEVDLLLRLAGTSQISEAIRGQGYQKGEPFLAMNAGRGEMLVPLGLGGAELPRKRLSKDELARIERAALLDAVRG